MRLLFSVMLAGLLLGATADAEQNQRSERKNRRAQHDGLVVHGDVRVVFSTGDVTRGCVATFKKRPENDWSSRPGSVSCSHLEQLVDELNL